MSDDKIYLNLTDLAAMAQEDLWVRLPSQVPSVIRNLAGKVMHTRRLHRLALRGVAILNEVMPEDLRAAENESAMARIKSLSSAERMHHTGRSNVLRSQARRREVFGYGYLLCVCNAEVL